MTEPRDRPMTDEQRLAWSRVNSVLDTYGESPEYRQAWSEWERIALGRRGHD